MGVAVDTTFVIDLLREDRRAEAKAREIQATAEARYLPAPVVYEVAMGLMLGRSRGQATAFRAVAANFLSLPLDAAAAQRAAEIQTELKTLGRRKAHIDVMIAGIALAGGHRLVTNDDDFDAVADTFGLQIERY